jgi:uncharacterized protein (TIGR03437 family)
VWLATLGLGAIAPGQSGQQIALNYSAASIVNAASNQPGPVAPATFVSIYGSELSNITRSISAEEIRNGNLPTSLTGTGLRVLVSSVPANIYYVSPSQINFLMPSNLTPGSVEVQVVVDGHAGASAFLIVNWASPALFQMDGTKGIAVHADNSLCTAASPAIPGEVIVLYATGLGITVPQTAYSQVPRSAALLMDLAIFRVVLDGVEVDPQRVLYAGVAPGFAGLFQVNVRLPEAFGDNPEIRLRASGQTSPAGIHLFAKTPQPPAAGARSIY